MSQYSTDGLQNIFTRKYSEVIFKQVPEKSMTITACSSNLGSVGFNDHLHYTLSLYIIWWKGNDVEEQVG